MVRPATLAAVFMVATVVVATGVPAQPCADEASQQGRADCRDASVREAADDVQGAVRLATAGLEALEPAVGPDDTDVVSCAELLARTATAMGDHRTALRAFETLLAAAVATHGAGSPEAAIARTKVAQAAADSGDLDAATAGYLRARSELEQALGPDHIEVAFAINGLANVLRRRGDYVEARRLLEQALDIYERRLDPDDPRLAGALNNLGNVQAMLGDLEAARKTYLRVLAIWERSLGPEAPNVAKALSNLGMVALNLGDPAGAVPLLERSVAIRENAFGSDAPVLAIPLINLGDAYLRTGDLERARVTMEHAIAILELNRADSTYLTEAVNNYGLLLLEEGAGAEAAAAFERAREIVEETAGHVHPRTAVVIANQARAAAFLDRPDAAVGYGLESERIAREHLRLTAAGLSEREALTYAVQERESLDLVLSLIAEFGVDDPTLLAATWDALIRSRGLVLEEMTLRRAMLAGYPEAAAAVDAWRSAADRLSQTLVDGPAEGEEDKAGPARRELERAERALGALIPPFDLELARSGSGFDDVQADLPAGSCLAAFSRFYRTWERDTDSWDQGPILWYLVFVRTPDGEISVEPLAEAAFVERAVASWRAAAGATSGGETVATAAGELLRQTIWDPVERRCAGADRILIVPDGELGLVKIPALPTSTDSFLVETSPPLAVLGHERDVIERPHPRRSGPCLLAVGAPDVGVGSTPADASSVAGGQPWGLDPAKFPALPGAEAEAEEAAELWTRSQPDGTAVPLIGTEATETAFKALAPDFSVIHLATHGFSLAEAGSTTAAGGRGVGGLVSAATDPAYDDPTTHRLSGLVFAGADRAEPGTDDGVLTAEEIATLDLDGVEWAVLSACDTGVGEVASYEGVFGLQRAFRTAGVQTVVMSLWQVDDEAAREWMEAFYHSRLIDGLPTADAVRAADLTVLAARRGRGDSVNPRFWAAFQATGYWR